MSPEFIQKWEHILEDVEKQKVPIQFIKKLIIKLEGKRQQTINIQKFLSQGLDPEKIEEAIDWLKKIDVVVGDKDMEYLEKICPTQSFKVWLPMVTLFAAFFEYKSGSVPKAKQLLSLLSNSKQRELLQFAQDQSENMNLAEEHRSCWVDLGSMIKELKALD
jgi:DNA-directed RNA polymerase subunit F